jgi:hypothetical protein
MEGSKIRHVPPIMARSTRTHVRRYPGSMARLVAFVAFVVFVRRLGLLLLLRRLLLRRSLLRWWGWQFRPVLLHLAAALQLVGHRLQLDSAQDVRQRFGIVGGLARATV